MNTTPENNDSQTQSGYDDKIKVAAHSEQQVRIYCRSHMLQRQHVVRIHQPNDLHGWRSTRLLLLPSWRLGTDYSTVQAAMERGWEIAEVTEHELLNGPTPDVNEGEWVTHPDGTRFRLDGIDSDGTQHMTVVPVMPAHYVACSISLKPTPEAVETNKTLAVGKSWVGTPPAESPTPTKVPLSDRIRPNSEAASWVCEEVKKLERQLAEAQETIAKAIEQLDKHQI